MPFAVAAACQPVKAPTTESSTPPAPPPPEYCAPTAPSNAQQYQSAFDALFAANTAGWVASDGGSPFTLPDGRILWMFGDTLTGRLGAGTNGAASLEKFASNGFIVQQDNCFKPRTEPVPRVGNQWFWPTDAIVDGANTLYVFGFRMKPAPGPFPFDRVHMEVARFALPDLTYLGRATLPHTGSPPTPTYGENVLVDGDTVYLYGHFKNFLAGRHYVARVPLSQLFTSSAWQFWNDDDPMTPDPTDDWLANPPGGADPIVFDDLSDPPTIDGPGAGLYVAPNPVGGGLLGSAFPVDAFDKRFIETWAAGAPQGPFTLMPEPAFDIRTAHGTLTDPRTAYGGRVVLDLPDGPIAQWSIGHPSIDAILANPSLYRVWFRTPNPGSIAPIP